MEDGKNLDLTTGPILGKLTALAIPILGTSCLQMLYNITNMVWLGRLSADSVAGAGIGGYVLWILSSMGNLTRSSSIILSSSAKGGNDASGMDRIARLSLFWSIATGVVFMGALLASGSWIVGLFGLESAKAVAEGESFIRVTGFGTVFIVLFPALSSLAIGWGDSKTPFYVSLLTVALNMALDPLFIFAFGMEAAGAAWATVIANAVGAAILLVKYRSHFEGFSRIRDYFHLSKGFLAIGAPQCLESSAYAVFSMLVGTVLGGFGPTVLATNSLGAQVESLTWMLAIGLASAATSFAGQNWGAKKYDRISRGYWAVLALAGSYATAIGLLFFFAPGLISGALTNQPDIFAMSLEYFAILAVSQPFMAVEIAVGGAFRGVQRPNFPAIVSIIVTISRYPLALFAVRTGLSYHAVWWIISGTSIVKGVIIGASFMPIYGRIRRKLALAAS